MFDVIVVSARGGIDLIRWRAVRPRHPLLRPIEYIRERNPFTRESRTLPAPDSAEVIVDGAVVGHLVWDDGRLLTPLEYENHRQTLERVAVEVAAELHAEVAIVDADDLELKPR